MLCYGLADLTTQSANRIVNRELCLYLLSWAKSCSILDDKGRNQTDETSLQGIGMKEANDESSSWRNGSDDRPYIKKDSKRSRLLFP